MDLGLVNGTLAADPAVGETLRRWGAALDAECARRSLMDEDVRRLVGLGWQIDVDDVRAARNGRGTLRACWEMTVALGLVLDPILIPSGYLKLEA